MTQNAHQLLYEERINTVINYICRNIGRELLLDELSAIACFSKFHFLRIFKALVGETVGDFIRRIRIEKAAYFLVYNPSASITQIALDCGFSSSQNFAKAFKAYYAVSPRAFRQKSVGQPLIEKSNPGNILSNRGNVTDTPFRYIDLVHGKTLHLQADSTVALQVKTEEYQDVVVAFIRKHADYTAATIAAAFHQLSHWALPRGLTGQDHVPMAVYWDNAAVTPMDKRRFDVCIPVDPEYPVSPPVHRQTLAGGRYAVYHADIKNNDFYSHWTRFHKLWFPSSGFIPDDRPCFERIYNAFHLPQEHALSVDICIPIKRI